VFCSSSSACQRGDYHFHSRYEFISVQAMETVVEVLQALVASFCG
jgi:di/tripeptidase